MPTWSLSIRPAAETDLPAVDVVVEAAGHATVRDLADALGAHLAPDRTEELVVPVDGSGPWAADRLLTECAIRTGDLLDVVTVPSGWRHKPSTAARTQAVVRIVEGPDAGRTIAVRTRSMTIGRAPTNTVVLTDPLVSSRHAKVSFDGIPMLVDEGSANGTVLDGDLISRATRLPWDSRISVGATTLVVQSADRVDEAEPAAVSVYRSPRFGEPLETGVLEVPAAPQKERPSPLPWTMLAMPMVMGAGMFMSTRSLYTLTYIFGWPIMGLGGWLMQKRQARKQFEKDLAVWQGDVDAIIAKVDAQAVQQRAQAAIDHPAADVLHSRVSTDDDHLWDRNIDGADFLVVRTGLGSVPALLTAALKDGGDREQTQGTKALLERRNSLDDQPVLAHLAESSVLAVVGAEAAVDDAVRQLVLRLAVGHSPADLTLAAILAPGRSHHESWLRWLPHVPNQAVGEARVAIGARDGQRLLDRLAAEDGGHGHTVCLLDEGAGFQRRTVEAIAATAVERRLHFIWMGSSPTTVPAATDLLLDVDQLTLSQRDRTSRSQLTVVDTLALRAAWRSARMLTGRVDEAAVLPADTALPAIVRLPDVSPDLKDADDVEGVLHRWSTRSGLRAQIGCGVDGVVSLDLREDGPHGLVAGTTGSGKSELLQSLIASLAVNNPPERITFLLVDYKGGAAFRECADLPHTVGYITDLTPALVHRALTSLGADIARREALLGEFGVKDLAQLEREYPDAAPPSLLICVDEFAALTAEVPDFVDGMVNIAQRGRSLGMHVLLATQRPQGVITPAIRANADLRIALRVSGTDESQDIIDTGDAARISRRTPGRAWIRRTGHGTADLVQAAWLGAREPIASERRAVTVAPFSAAFGGEAKVGGEVRLDPRTDLERCVQTVTTAFERTGAPAPRKPWLPPLPSELLLTVEDVVAGAAKRTAGEVPIGRIDDPASQRQPELVVDYATVGHVLAYGASGSGKSELLRTVALSASLTDAHVDNGLAPYVYGLDFAGGGLAVIGDLPTVGAVIPEAQTGRVLRLLRILRKTVQERSDALAATGSADLVGLARAGHPVPRVHLLIDNLPAVVDMLESGGTLRRTHLDMLQTILQNGRRVGIHVTATAPGRTGIPAALASTFGRRLVLRMTNGDDYAMLGVPSKILDADSPAGMALYGKRPCQVATVGGAGTPVQVERIAHVRALLEPLLGDRNPGEVPPMPGLVPAEAMPPARRADLPIAVDANSVSVVTADLLRAPILIAGRARSGRTGALQALSRLARGSDAPPTTIVYAGPLASAVARGGEHPAYDVLLADPTALATWLGEWTAGRAERVPEAWALLLVDDAHVWDRDADNSAPVRDAVTSLSTALADAPALGIALVVVGDTDEARTRTLSPGLVQLARRARRGVLFQAEGVDGSVFGITVPMHTVEPLTGPGRGLWCADGSATLVQAVVDTTGQ